MRSFAGLASRRGFAEKDPRGWAEFLRQVRDHSAVGSAHMLRGVQMKRKTVFELEPELGRLEVPVAHRRGRSGRALPRARPLHEAPHPPRGARHPADDGHTANIEEPGLFNLHVAEFLAAVENGRWGTWKAEKPARR